MGAQAVEVHRCKQEIGASQDHSVIERGEAEGEVRLVPRDRDDSDHAGIPHLGVEGEEMLGNVMMVEPAKMA